MKIYTLSDVVLIVVTMQNCTMQELLIFLEGATEKELTDAVGDLIYIGSIELADNGNYRLL